jgi:uncharacterized membrane protein
LWMFRTGVRRSRTVGSGADKEQKFLRQIMWLMVGIEYFIVLLLCALSLIPLMGPQMWNHLPWYWLIGIDLGVVVVAITICIRAGQGGWKLQPAGGAMSGTAELAGDGTPDAFWRWGMIYANPNDPALFVAQRYGTGYTLNFSNRKAWLFLVGIVTMILFSVAISLVMVFTAHSPAAR